MKRTKENAPLLPQRDYGQALKSAVSWLGDRYLLAEPARRLQNTTPYFVEQRRWHDAARKVEPTNRVAGGIALVRRPLPS